MLARKLNAKDDEMREKKNSGGEKEFGQMQEQVTHHTTKEANFRKFETFSGSGTKV
jgi:hypothetical protein